MAEKMNRIGFVGGTDISAICGVSRWLTPLQLWAIKTGQVESADLSEVEAVQLGKELEDFVAKKFERETGLAVRKPGIKQYVHKEYDWARCQVDRLITGTDDLLECKTCSGIKYKEWDGDSIPEEYILQCFWQLLITGRKTAYIAVLIGGQKFMWKKIEQDLAFQDTLLQKAKDFWDLVKRNIPPSAMLGDDDVLLALHPKSNDQIQAVQELESAVALRQEISGQIVELEKQRDEIEVRLKEAIGDNLGIKTNKYIVTWAPTKTKRVDSDRMKQDGIYEAYLKESEYRRMGFKLNKGKNNGKHKRD